MFGFCAEVYADGLQVGKVCGRACIPVAELLDNGFSGKLPLQLDGKELQMDISVMFYKPLNKIPETWQKAVWLQDATGPKVRGLVNAILIYTDLYCIFSILMILFRLGSAFLKAIVVGRETLRNDCSVGRAIIRVGTTVSTNRPLLLHDPLNAE